MRVLVTGVSGLLGAAVLREFGAAAIPVDRQALDLTDREAVRRTVTAARPDAILNCAVYNGVDRAEDEPSRALDVNAFGVQSLARAASETGAILVHYSTDFVFDGTAATPYTEEDAPNPLNVYGASKLLGDWFALAAPKAYVLRVESLFGEPAADPTRRGSLATIVEKILAGEETPVFVDRTVSPTHTADIARATRALLETQAPSGLYHCVNSGHGTWEQIAQQVASLLGKPLRSRPITLETAGLRARRPRYCAMSNEKLAAAAYAMPDLEEALASYIEAALKGFADQFGHSRAD